MRSQVPPRPAATMILVLFLTGCGDGSTAGPTAQPAPAAGGPIAMSIGASPTGSESDPDKVRTVDYSILFVGNSHTFMHDLPKLVCEMIRFRHPKKTTYSHTIPVAFLEDLDDNPGNRVEVETRSWKFVVLQAQKISVSGKHNYSRKEGIDFAKLAKARGAAVYFFPEWGLKNVAGDGPRQEKVYAEMARDADVGLAPVGRAWDLAPAERPNLPLHGSDGNHQSALGAFLTACVLVGRLTGESPAELASYPYPEAGEDDRKFLAGVAAKALAPAPPGGVKP